MNPSWQSFLISEGAQLDAAATAVSHFGDSDAERKAAGEGSVMADLSQYGLIRAQGPEAQTFLQGQFSNDIQLVTDTRAQLSSYSNAKGRMLAILRIFLHDGSYFLVLPRALLPSTLKRLKMFVLRAKVALEDASDEFVSLGLAGVSTDAILQEVLSASGPESAEQIVKAADVIALRLTGPRPRFQLFATTERARSLWSELKARTRPVGQAAWTLTEILAGEPKILPQTVEAFVPQMANLEVLQGISFTKGCYPGQEIVARSHYLGSLKRRMYALRIDAPIPPDPGTDVFVDVEASQPVGKIVEAAAETGERAAALAVLQIEHADKGLRIGSSAGPKAMLVELPYSL